ncbi:fibroblast growth factor 22 [Hyla sarda]|uniref:fibroblast growth factor 22 n=1 Tax=Hyla sarda TaxID=327740 RepID=UPI0024C31CAB|nr:fibroblast growth factor 22 [Hyla sarda]XP_056373999.1 fibroblast growth factor 22 [Hyla sarda]XP_056374000.1 fibroblast growth factor 22 [Hyla sarda]
MHKAPFPTTTSLYLKFCILLLLAVSTLSPCVKGNRLIHSYKHLEGDVRWRRFFSATHYFLSIDQTGQVRGIRKFSTNSIFQVYSVNVGVVAMHSAGTGLYIAMDSRGKLYGVKEYGPNCEFQERIEENGYNTYSSVRWRHNGNFMYLALRENGLARLGRRTRRTHYSTHFLPVSI